MKSGASVAAISNNEALTYITAEEAALLKMNGSTMDASLKATVSQADADEKSIIDAADAQKTQAICQMTGAIGGAGITGAGALGLFSPSSETSAIPVKLTTEAVPAGGIVPPPRLVPAASATMVANGTGAPVPAAGTSSASAALAGVGEGAGNPPGPGAPAGVRSGTPLVEAATEAKNKITSEDGITRAKNTLEATNGLGSYFSTGMTGLGQTLAYDKLVAQGNENKIKDLEAGITGVLGNLVSSNSGMISALGQSQQSTVQLMRDLLPQRQG
jgi:hypothetical protein